MSVRLALHWAAVTILAAIASTVAALPFTGGSAYAASVVAAAGVCLIGTATTPNPTRKDGS